MGEGNTDRIRERLSDLDRRELIGLVCVGAVLVAAAGLWYVRSLPKAVRIEATSGGAPRSGTGPLTGATASPEASPVVVDVAGWVRHPGVYEMHEGDRVIDAIRVAGGARPGADLTSLNLASLLQDAQQVLVLRRGAGLGGGGSGTASGAGGKINLNAATLDQLESLPGIGEVLGQRILDYRQAHGPFHAVDDLLNVSGIGPSHLADLKDLVTV
jgi:competence protein ComEA